MYIAQKIIHNFTHFSQNSSFIFYKKRILYKCNKKGGICLNLYDLCQALSLYITRYINENNENLINLFTPENIQIMIRQHQTSELEFFLTARKSLEAILLLDSLNFYNKVNSL